ncbi:MAG: ferredoxin [Polyangiaceae bacterium]|nr:ferredoxin [Polyangiaceae bacterium]
MAAIDSLVVTINCQLCLGDGVCCDHARETFELDDDGSVRVRSKSTDERGVIIQAARSCRMDAISVIDRATGEQLAPCHVQTSALPDEGAGSVGRTGT